MSSVVFLRGVNVGGHRTFRPAAFVKELLPLDVVNVGAAGTFVVRSPATAASLRAALVRRLPVETEIMICRGRDVSELAGTDPFPAASGDVRRFVTVVARRPAKLPALPVSRPEGAWQVKIVGIRGKFVLSVWRRGKKALVYPNEVVERVLGVPATTRNWETIEKIREALRGD